MSIWNEAGPQGGFCFRPAGLTVTIINVGKGALEYITSLLEYLLWLEAIVLYVDVVPYPSPARLLSVNITQCPRPGLRHPRAFRVRAEELTASR